MRLIALALFTLTLSNAYSSCEERLAYQVDARSDYPLKIKLVKELQENEEVSNYRGHVLFQNYYTDKSVDLYTATGSFHSGWFQVGLIVDKKNCELLNEFTMAAE